MDNSRPQHLLQIQLEGSLKLLMVSHLSSDRFDLNHLVVNVEAENKCQLTNTTAAVEMRVSCISRKWTLEKLDRELCLLPSESGAVHLKGSRLEWQTSRRLVYSDVPLGPTLVSGMLPYPYAAATLRQLGACLVLLNAMLSLPFRFPAIPFL